MDEAATEEPGTELPPAQEPLKDDPPVVPDPTPPTDDDDGKPGGDSPQAVRARKEYQARKRVETELAQEREQRIRLEERTRALEEQANRAPKTEDRIFTIAEINAAVEAGSITREVGDRYIDEKIIPARVEQVISARENKTKALEPVEAAGKYVDEFIGVMPSLSDKTSDDFIKVATKHRELVQMGLPNDFRTQKVALEMVHGTLDDQREKKRIADLNARPPRVPTDGGAGGGTPPAGQQPPQHLVAYWERTGTSEADRKKELDYWRKNQQKAKAK